jgi:hypothetical protein
MQIEMTTANQLVAVKIGHTTLEIGNLSQPTT